MNCRVAALMAVLWVAAPVSAHRLDEYLQATIVSIERGEVQASMRLIPGVAVAGAVIAAADRNRDGVLSEAEQKAYAEAVLRDLVVMADGRQVVPRLVSVSFPALSEMRAGVGEIHVEFRADLPAAWAGASERTLTIENRHQAARSVYLMNSLVPRDTGIRVTAQIRNDNQSFYRVDYTQEAAGDSWRTLWKPRVDAALSPLAGVPEMFRLGMRHIAEGTDHLLFLIVLLLPTPLIANHGRWTPANNVRTSLLQIVRVVSAFTAGHSITLALGALGVVSLPARVVEVLIAISILVSAVHAWRAVFPGREPAIAAFFGLIHGLAFATTLQNLGIGAWQRAASIVGFNLGIETMQLCVVAAVLPSLMLLSRTAAYPVFRRAGALVAGVASAGWIVERVSSIPLGMDALAASVAARGQWIAVCLAVGSALLWLRSCFSGPRVAAFARGDGQPAQ